MRFENFVKWTLFKSLVFSIAIFYLNLHNGFSGQQPIEAFVFAMYNVNMTNFALSFFTLFDHDLSFRKYGSGREAEAGMSFKVSEAYK